MDEQLENWTENEFQHADLGDERRKRRLLQLAAALGDNPSESLPQAVGNPAALKAAYRFFENPANKHQAILDSHILATYQRMRTVPVVLAVQDTTYLNWTHEPLEAKRARYEVGAIMHSTLAITPERVVLGVLQTQIWEREPKTYPEPKDHKQRPIEDKESYKWLTSLDSVITAQAHVPGVQFVSVGDAEADVYELFVKERPAGVDLLVRAAQDRRLATGKSATLRKALAPQPVAALLEMKVARTPDHPERRAPIEVRWKQVRLHPPQRPAGQKLPSVSVWAVWAVEPNPPANVERVEWMLLTTVPVQSTEEALERLDWYACRWGIEVWHKVLKSGCKVESRQLDDLEKFKRLLVVFSVIAWRIMYVTMLARAVPEAPCTLFFEEAEWQAAYCTLHNTRILPPSVPSLQEAVWMVARLGGFMGPVAKKKPGVTVLWKGFQRLADLTMMYKLLQPPKLEQ